MSSAFTDPDMTVHCKTAKYFLAALAPTSQWFATARIREWIFRGQSDVSWGLTPSAFRPHELLTEPHKSDPFGEWHNAHQIAAEFYAVRRFFESADASGLRLPEDSQFLREKLQTLDTWRAMHPDEPISWPSRELWSLLALAQHYGVPTRFLDWTRNSYVAAYFAVRDALFRENRPDVAVWAFSTRLASISTLVQNVSVDYQVHLVTAPYADNVNLRAQQGVHLVLSRDALEPHESADRYDLNNYLRTLQSGSAIAPVLKFVLPGFECRPAMALLARFGVTAASLFPGYEGVVSSMREEQLWSDAMRFPSQARKGRHGDQ